MNNVIIVHTANFTTQNKGKVTGHATCYVM